MIPGLLDYIKENHDQQTAEQMAEHLGADVQYLEAVCYWNNLEIWTPHWTDQEITILKAKFSSRPWQEIFDCLPGRDEKAIRHKAAQLGLSRRKYEPVNP